MFIQLLLSATSRSQTITTFAGGGAGADGGPAINASIAAPTWGVFDKWNNYYMVCVTDHSIRKVNASGIISTVVGAGYGGYNGDGGMADTSAIFTPGSVTVDTAGNLYIADVQNNRVRKVDVTTNIITTIAGTGIAGYSGDNGPAINAQLNSPNDICFDKAGNLYVSDAINCRIRKIAPSGIITTIAGTGIYGFSGDGGPALSAELGGLRGLAIDSSGSLFIADWEQNSVRKINLSTGIIIKIAGTGPSGYIFNGDNIQALSANVRATRVAFNKDNDLYIADHENQRIRKVVMSSGIITTVAGDGTMSFGGDGGSAVLAQLNKPSGIAFDSCSNLYITQVNDGRIRKVTFNDTCGITSTNTISRQTQSINIYPNPAYSQITITANGNLKEATITNAIGQVAVQQKIDKEKAEISITNLQPGIYFVTITDANGVKVVKKIVKE